MPDADMTFGRALSAYGRGDLLTRRTRCAFAAHVTAGRRGQPNVAGIDSETGAVHGPSWLWTNRFGRTFAARNAAERRILLLAASGAPGFPLLQESVPMPPDTARG